MYQVLFLLSTIFLNLPDADGWVTLDQPAPVEEEIEEDGKWVLFSTTLGEEKFWVRFPKEPSYSYTTDGIKLQAASEEVLFFLDVRKIEEKNVSTLLAAEKEARAGAVFLEENVDVEKGHMHLCYLLEGRWVEEDLLLSSHNLYTLKTEKELHQLTNLHQAFVSSFECR